MIKAVKITRLRVRYLEYPPYRSSTFIAMTVDACSIDCLHHLLFVFCALINPLRICFYPAYWWFKQDGCPAEIIGTIWDLWGPSSLIPILPSFVPLQRSFNLFSWILLDLVHLLISEMVWIFCIPFGDPAWTGLFIFV